MAPQPHDRRWAWFVPVEFALVGIGAGLAVPHVERAVTGMRISFGAGSAIGEVLLFAGLYVTTAVE